jgi:hypothetical protein
MTGIADPAMTASSPERAPPGSGAVLRERDGVVIQPAILEVTSPGASGCA